MRKLSLITLAGLITAGCGTTRPEPVIYSERVSVHSVLPVHVRMHEAYGMDASVADAEFAFDANYQSHFVESLKTALVDHGVFGSISESGGDDVFEIDVNFARVASFPGSNHYKLTVALTTAYQGERDFSQYHVVFLDDVRKPEQVDNRSNASHRQAATELMSLIMGDIQQAVADRKVSLKAHVKERRMAIPRVLVKW